MREPFDIGCADFQTIINEFDLTSFDVSEAFVTSDELEPYLSRLQRVLKRHPLINRRFIMGVKATELFKPSVKVEIFECSTLENSPRLDALLASMPELDRNNIEAFRFRCGGALPPRWVRVSPVGDAAKQRREMRELLEQIDFEGRRCVAAGYTPLHVRISFDPKHRESFRSVEAAVAAVAGADPSEVIWNAMFQLFNARLAEVRNPLPKDWLGQLQKRISFEGAKPVFRYIAVPEGLGGTKHSSWNPHVHVLTFQTSGPPLSKMWLKRHFDPRDFVHERRRRATKRGVVDLYAERVDVSRQIGQIHVEAVATATGVGAYALKELGGYLQKEGGRVRMSRGFGSPEVGPAEAAAEGEAKPKPKAGDFGPDVEFYLSNPRFRAPGFLGLALRAAREFKERQTVSEALDLRRKELLRLGGWLRCPVELLELRAARKRKAKEMKRGPRTGLETLVCRGSADDDAVQHPQPVLKVLNPALDFGAYSYALRAHAFFRKRLRELHAVSESGLLTFAREGDGRVSVPCYFKVWTEDGVEACEGSERVLLFEDGLRVHRANVKFVRLFGWGTWREVVVHEGLRTIDRPAPRGAKPGRSSLKAGVALDPWGRGV